MKIIYDAASDMGCVRSNNEDMILIDRSFLRDESASGEVFVDGNSRFCAIVADGMGGNNGGEFASDIACQEFDSWINDIPSKLTHGEIRAKVNEFVLNTHTLINSKGDEMEEFSGMGTTLVGIFFYEGSSYWVNIGDSRIYIYRDGILRQISRDHSMRNLMNNPELSANLIYNSLGSGTGTDSFADCDNIPLFENDCILICSDGLSDMVDDEKLALLLKQSAPASAYVSSAKAAGGEDNISVITLSIYK